MSTNRSGTRSDNNDKGFLAYVKSIDNRVFKLENFHWRGRHRYVPLDNIAAILTLTGRSTTGFTDLDLSTLTPSGGGSTLSDNTIAVQLNVAFKDSGSAASVSNAQFRVNGGAGLASLIVPGYHINSQFNYEQGIVAVDSDYILEYAINATGGSTAALTVYIVGYIEQLTK